MCIRDRVDYVEKPAQAGEYTYPVMARIKGKEGLPVSRKVWVGHDISEPVRDLKVMTINNNLHVKLTWAQPEKGAHCGYFNRDEVTYSVSVSYTHLTRHALYADLSFDRLN